MLDPDGDWISVEGDYEIGIGCRMLQGTLPQSIGIGRPYPGAVIALVDHMRQGNPGLLDSADVAAYVHQKSRIGRERFQIVGNFSLQRDPGARVDDRFLKASLVDTFLALSVP